MNIDKVFTESKVTLVCDKDVMEIDITNLTIKVQESLLATLIVSDWNLRAWTFLEAFRGRESIFLLCKNNVVVSLREIVDAVHSEGSIDISILLLNTPKLLPGRNMQGRERDPALSSVWKDRPPPLVCGRKRLDSEEGPWEWKDVFEWDTAEPQRSLYRALILKNRCCWCEYLQKAFCSLPGEPF